MYPSLNTVRVIKSKLLRFAGHVTWIREDASVFKILTVKHTGNIPLERPRRKWEGSIRMDF